MQPSLQISGAKRQPAHPRHPLASDTYSEHRLKPVPSHPHRFVATGDATPKQ